MADAHTNFAYSVLTNAPGTGGVTFIVQDGDEVRFPDVPFNATVWGAGTQPTLTGVAGTTAEVVRVTAKTDNTFTVVRLQEGLVTARTVVVGDQIAATVTAKTLTDAEAPLTFWTPFILGSGAASGLQTLAANFTTVVGTNSLYVFPVTVPQNLAFNQIVLANSLSYVTSNLAAASNSYYSYYGLYTMNANTLSLVSSSSFSIGETLNSVSLTWNYPTATATSGWGYGSLISGTGNLSTTAQMVSYISATRLVGLQFGGNMTLSGGLYWLGLLTLKTTGNSRSTYGLSNAGIFGQPRNAINAVGTVSGLLPIGFAASDWSSQNTHLTQWWGRHIIGFVTATSIANFGGSVIPANITLSALGAVAAASTGTILPTVTFVST